MWLDKELESPLVLNSIICMIDFYNFFRNYEENEEILKKQLICADKIILNKLDLLDKLPNSQDIKTNIKAFIQKTNPLSKVYEYLFFLIRTTFADLSLNTFLEGLNLNSNKIEDTENISTNTNTLENKCCNCVSDHSDHINNHIHFAEKYKIENVLVRIKPRKFTKEELDKLIGDILWNDSDKYGFNIIRLKGVVYQDDKIYYIQGIYDIYEINYITVNESYNYELKKETSKILFIGRNLINNSNTINSKFI